MSEEQNSGCVSLAGESAPELELLMQRYQQADSIATESLLRALIPILRRFFLSTPDGRQTTDDLVQETLLRIHRARHTYRSGEPLLPWMYAIARHVRIDFYRKRRRVTAREEQVESEILQEKPAAAEQNPLLPDFETLMRHLPDSQREVVTMLKVLGMTVEEVAQVTASTTGAVKQKAHRAYETLRGILEKPAARGSGR